MKKWFLAASTGVGIYLAGQGTVFASAPNDWQQQHQHIAALEDITSTVSAQLATWQSYTYAMERGKRIRQRINNEAPHTMKVLRRQVRAAGNIKASVDSRLLRATATSLQSASKQTLAYIADYSHAIHRGGSGYRLQRIQKQHSKALSHVEHQLEAAQENLQSLQDKQ